LCFLHVTTLHFKVISTLNKYITSILEVLV